MNKITETIHQHIRNRTFRLTIHAQDEMIEDDVTVSELLTALKNGTVVENYPEYERGACCLICGKGHKRFLHIVCTTTLPELVVITVYEPMPPKWTTPFERGIR